MRATSGSAVSKTPGGATGDYSRRSFWAIVEAGAPVALAIHVIFGALFFALNITGMVFVNVGSVGCYALVIVRLKMRRARFVTTIILLEIVGHSVLATRLLGLDSGFQYYILVVVPVIFLNGQGRSMAPRMFRGVLLLAIYLGLDYAMHRLAPVYDTPGIALELLRNFNIASTFLILGQLSNVYYTTIRKAEARLQSMALTDPLTGAMNRRGLLETAAKRPEKITPYSLVIIDIDHFKRVNDAHGHDGGDHVLVELCGVMQAAVRPDDLLARWGGEEFVMLLPKTKGADALVVAERVRQAVETQVLDFNDKPIAVTVTLGLAEARTEETVSACIARADEALYRGKRSGRNCVVQS